MINQRNRDIDTLCDFIEEYQALNRISPGYINDPADVDREGCFVSGPCEGDIVTFICPKCGYLTDLKESEVELA